MRFLINSKKITGVLLALGISSAAFAAPLNGTYTIGGTTPSYATLSAAITALNTEGVSGPVTFNIRKGNHFASGTSTVWQGTINNVTGASATNRITFKAENDSASTVSINFNATSTTNNFIFKLNGASYITIKHLTLIDTSATYNRTIELAGAASNDSITNCVLVSKVRISTSTNTAVVYASGITGGNNVIANNTFQNGSYSLYYAGTSTTNLAPGIVIANNAFKNSYQYYLNVDNTSDAKVIGNVISTYAAASTTSYGIRMDNCHGALEIRNNKLDTLRSGYGIYVSISNASAANRGIIANNIVIFGATSALCRGIYSTGTSYHSIYNNTVNVPSTSATTGYAGYFDYDAATEVGNEIYNNVFANTGAGYAIYVDNPTFDNTFDYNNLYAAGAKLVDQGITTPATDFATLTAWRAASGREMNSISYNPAFTSAKNLQPNAANAASWSLNGRGIHISGNDKDINGNTRAVTTAAGVPDIGAYEFTPTVAPPTAVATPAAPAAGGTQVFTFGEDTVATIAWDASSAVPSTITVKQYSGTAPAGISAVSSTQMFFYTDIAAAAGTYNYTGNIYYKEPWLGTIAAESGLRLVKKDGANPWQPFSPAVSGADVNRNIIVTPNLTSFGWNTGIDVANNASAFEITEPAGYVCSGSTPVKIKVKNAGSNAINSVQLNWQVNGVMQTPISYTTVIPINGEAIVTLGNVTLANGFRNIKVWTSLPNNGLDPVSQDDTISVSIRDGLSGVFTIGGTAPDYPTISAAISAINQYGVCGPVTFNIRNGSYTEQAQLNPVTGASAVNRITFKSESGNPANVTIAHDAAGTADNYIFRIGASNVSIKDITLATKDSTYTRAIELMPAVSNDSIVNCHLVAFGTTKSSVNGALVFADNMTGKNNVIKGNTFSYGSYGLHYSGTSTTNLADSAVIVENTFNDQYVYAAYIYYTNNVKVLKNTVSTGSGVTTFYGLYCAYADGPVEVIGNKVTANSGGYGIYMYYCDAPATAKSLVANNVIVMGDGTKTVHGLRSYYSSNQRVYNNSVNITGTSATNGIAGYFYYTSATYEGNEIRNNVFSNTGGGYAMYVYNPTYANAFDYNNLYTKGPKLVDRGTPAADYATLTAWRAAHGLDRNSISFNPGFTSTTDLKPNAANDSSWSLNGRGIHLAGNNKDIDGGTRAVTTSTGVPDIGAYEFTPTVVPPLAAAVPANPAANTTQVFTLGEDTVATINWDATAAVPSTIEVRQYTGTLPVGISAISPRSMYFYTDIAASAGTYNYNSSIYYKDPWIGTITAAEQALRLAKKDGTNPWAVSNPTNSTSNITRNFIYTTGLTDFGHNTGIDIANNAGVSSLTSPPARLCTGTFPVKAIVKNNGSNVLNNVKVNWTVDGVGQPTLNYTTPIAVNSEAEVALGTIVFTNGGHTIKIWTSEPNGAVDSVSADDTLSITLRDGLAGVYTVGGTTPDYTTINAAITDLNKYGMCGAVTLSIRPGNYNEQVQVDSIQGLSAANRLTFKSEANDATTVNINFAATVAANNYVFRINHASFVTVKDLSFTANGTAQARAMQFVGATSFDSVLNCRLVGPTLTTASTNTALLFGDDLTGEKIVFKGNTFQNGSYGAYFRGTSATSLVNGVVFDGNTFDNQFTYAAYPYYVQDLKFNNNLVTTNSTDNTFYGIYTGYCDGALEITRNKVVGPQGGYGIYVYYSDATSGTRGLVSNNTISMGAGTNASYGLRIYYSSYQNVYNNSVNIISGSATSYAGYIYSNAATYDNNDIKNNVFANQGIGYALFVYNPVYNTSDYNNLYTAGAKLVDLGTPATDYTTLQAWKLASGQELNSIAYDPGFVSATDLHPNAANPASWSLNGRGVHIASNNLDIDKNPRITNIADGAPDLGAYEFTPTSTPPAAVAIPATPAPGTRQVYTFGQDTVAVIDWKANSVMPNFIEIRQYSGEKAPQYPAPGFMYFHTDINTQSVTHNFDAVIYYKDIWKGTIATESNLRMMKKLGSNPWTAFNGTESSVDIVRNMLSVSSLSSFGVFTGGNNGDIFSATIKPVSSTVFCPGGSVILNANTGANYSYQWNFNGSPIPGATSPSMNATAAGEYTVTVTDNVKNLTATSDKLAITITPAPNAQISASGALTYCPGSSLTLSTPSVPGLTYQWQLNGSNITGATNASYAVTSAGQYTVMVNNIACSAVSPITTVNAGPLQLSIGNDTAFCESPNASLVLDAGNAGASYTWNTGATSQQIAAITSGKYWVIVDAGAGCVGTDTIQVTVNPLPSVSGISYSRSGNTFNFSASGVQNVISYLWTFNDGVTSTVPTPSHTFTIAPTDVKLIVTNDCGNDTIALNFTTGVDDVNKEAIDLNLYPNPANDKITLQVEGTFVLENIVVVNQLGQVVMKEELSGGVKTKTLDVSNLPVGYYILRAGTSDGQVAKPFNIVR